MRTFIAGGIAAFVLVATNAMAQVPPLPELKFAEIPAALEDMEQRRTVGRLVAHVHET